VAPAQVVLRHSAPMPVGSSIRITVRVTHALRRQLSFSCEVHDAANPLLCVASGSHQRVYICSDAFDGALSAKAGETGIRVGLTGTSTHFVDVQHIASREVFGGPRSVEALATSSLMNWAEEAAIAALEEHLPAGSTTVGGETAMAHVAPTPKGMQVTCRAVLARISSTRKGALRLLFELSGTDRIGAVMTGTHLRFLVDRDEFEQRARGVLMPDGRRRGSWAGAIEGLTLNDVPMPPPRPDDGEGGGGEVASDEDEMGLDARMPPRHTPATPRASGAAGAGGSAAAAGGGGERCGGAGAAAAGSDGGGGGSGSDDVAAAVAAAVAATAARVAPSPPRPSMPSSMAMGGGLPAVTHVTGAGDFLF
jgi:predicted thioesterase